MTLTWFILGWLIGIATFAIISIIVIDWSNKQDSNEEFVKKLVEKEGWMGAQEVLTWHYNSKYMRTWRRLYREHIENEEE